MQADVNSKIYFFLFKDHILIELNKTDLKSIDDKEASQETRILVVNPNYVLED